MLPRISRYCARMRFDDWARAAFALSAAVTHSCRDAAEISLHVSGTASDTF